MSLDVALQSVAFYVLSCSTCAKINHRRKRKQQARREKEEKAKLETEQPGLYRHPSPFSTNPYWHEEINLGPALKGKKSRNHKGFDAGETSASDVSFDQSSSTMVGSLRRLSGDKWNWRRYEREDEELWGHELLETGHRFMDAIARAGSDAISKAGTSMKNTSRMIEERLSVILKDDESEPPPTPPPHSYQAAKNPPVNDLHPPVVSTINHPSQTKWMLQPPPPAKIMEGKMPVPRSRSGSVGTKSRPGKQLDALPSDVDELDVAALHSVSKASLTSDRSSDPPSAGRRPRPPPLDLADANQKLAAGADACEDSDADDARPKRPALSTIASSSLIVPK